MRRRRITKVCTRVCFATRQTKNIKELNIFQKTHNCFCCTLQCCSSFSTVAAVFILPRAAKRTNGKQWPKPRFDPLVLQRITILLVDFFRCRRCRIYLLDVCFRWYKLLDTRLHGVLLGLTQWYVFYENLFSGQ